MSQPNYPEGFALLEDFITPEEEAELLEEVGATERRPGVRRNSVQRYGAEVGYGRTLGEIPEMFARVGRRLVQQGLLEAPPTHVTVNEYRAGQGIGPHVDSRESGSVITILSLLGSATMRLMKLKEPTAIVEVKPRSLIQLRGAARSQWKHSIDPVPGPRYSIVFRNGEE